mmetsp:Transcript_24651/g.31871  ORF Transcript_24651/g.31871 Transcript_24651/m.31871 type:complete len:462 (+) Transcript_24651:410-1795(+)
MGCGKSKVTTDEIYQAAKDGNVDLVKHLMDLGGASVTAILNTHALREQETALAVACRNGHVGIVRILLEHGADVNYVSEEEEEQETPLIKAIRVNNFSPKHVKIVQLLLEKDAKVNERNRKGETALIIACKRKQEKTVEALLEKGADVDIQRKNDQLTAMMMAAKKKSEPIVRLLLENKGIVEVPADPQNQDNEGTNSRDKIIRKPANPNLVNSEQISPLMMAAKTGSLSIVKLLLKYGANVDLQDENGRTALIWAVQHGHFEVSKLLVETGANKDLRTKDDRSAAAMSQMQTRDMQKLFGIEQTERFEIPSASNRYRKEKDSIQHLSTVKEDEEAKTSLERLSKKPGKASKLLRKMSRSNKGSSFSSDQSGRILSQSNKGSSFNSIKSAVVLDQEPVQAIPMGHSATVDDDGSKCPWILNCHDCCTMNDEISLADDKSLPEAKEKFSGLTIDTSYSSERY